MSVSELETKSRLPAGQRPPPRFIHFLKNLGPGLITGASDDDPSGISTYSIAGASAGLSMLWVALFTTPMMAVVQGMCARIGMVAGRGLASVMRSTLPNWLALSLGALVIGANTLNAGADFAGMAASAHMVLGLPVLLWVAVFGIGLLLFQMYASYQLLANICKWLTLALFAYVFTAFKVHPNWLAVLRHTIVPEFHLHDPRWIMTLVGVLGTTITPYLFFWQAALMVEEEKQIGRTTVAQRRGATDQEIVDAHADVNAGMVFSNIVMFFIITTTAVTLGAHGNTQIASAQDAAAALRPFAGNFTAVLFALGMVGTGLLAIPALTGSSAYVASGIFTFREGLNEPPRRARKFYYVLAAGIIVGMLMNVFRIDPIKALFYSAVVNGVAAVPLIVAITFIANNRRIMGRWKNSLLANIWSGLTICVMGAAAVLMFVFWNQQ